VRPVDNLFSGGLGQAGGAASPGPPRIDGVSKIDLPAIGRKQEPLAAIYIKPGRWL
jgi:hypothetical protein